MIDIVKLARGYVFDDVHRTHYEGCESEHVSCLMRKLADEIERLRADAERYRWLRERAPFWAWQPDSNCYPGITVGFSHSETKYCDYTLDEAIDAAMKVAK